MRVNWNWGWHVYAALSPPPSHDTEAANPAEEALGALWLLVQKIDVLVRHRLRLSGMKVRSFLAGC